jgi:predicted phosphodiesterase
MPFPCPVAVIADVHGNRWALDAVVADARAQRATRFLDLGDCVSGPLDPRGTAERLIALGAPTVRGNHDRAVAALSALDPGDPAAGRAGASDRFACEQLTDAQHRWLAALPAALPPGAAPAGLLACHGAPGDDERYLLEEPAPGGLRTRSPAEVRALLGDALAGGAGGGSDAGAAGRRGGAPGRSGGPVEVVLCGHTHLQRLLPLGGGAVVVNPGSVGLPAYAGTEPYPHVVESGSPHARYALLHPLPAGGWRVELRAVAYPWAAAAAAARTNGSERWAAALETGLAPPTLMRGR